MFLDWKIQLEKVQLTRDLKDDTITYQGIRLPCKNGRGYFYPTLHAHKQQLFGSPKTPAPHFK